MQSLANAWPIVVGKTFVGRREGMGAAGIAQGHYRMGGCIHVVHGRSGGGVIIAVRCGGGRTHLMYGHSCMTMTKDPQMGWGGGSAQRA